jgi:hypothetical protein
MAVLSDDERLAVSRTSSPTALAAAAASRTSGDVGSIINLDDAFQRWISDDVIDR